MKAVIEKGLLLEMWFKMNVRANDCKGDDSPSNLLILSLQDFTLSFSTCQLNSLVGGRKCNLEELSLRLTEGGSQGTDSTTSNEFF